MKLLSRVRLFVTPWTVSYQAPPSMKLSRQKYWNGLPFPSPDLPDVGIKPGSPTLQADALPSEPPGSPNLQAHPDLLGPCGNAGSDSLGSRVGPEIAFLAHFPGLLRIGALELDSGLDLDCLWNHLQKADGDLTGEIPILQVWDAGGARIPPAGVRVTGASPPLWREVSVGSRGHRVTPGAPFGPRRGVQGWGRARP